MSEIIILASITLLASISPGPDFIVVMKNALKSRKLGYLTALGVGSAIFVHVAYCIAGIGLVISQSIILFSIIKTLGAIYLLYISYQLFRSKKEKIKDIEVTKNQSGFLAFREGFLTNVMNPKATIFFLSVFTQVINPNTLIITQFLYGVMMASIVGGWFLVLTTVVNLSPMRSHISGVQYYLNKVMGALLAFLGIKILLSSSK
ncbi:MAG: LysE family transporter [Candidatus Gracilibacteria bacterium]|nr:LysE family transporter [Candidatus Gracilibacteria bacterium]